ncbi:uncharacterized protein YqhQ [Keratinibaculum paraultunense]|uniref:Uncharacterized protein YqhQ n=1 Tax=Keratinibaculum paraultunense TaxID=1278232 RepID=A0A4R3KUC3_9FIRM|nr:DUF1385 domain-containing protein [Keratinibaculum paraultunense]QQY79196.1 DUF1385 domain-containing protein [Keratinibaculum paraultunense]TCS88580.1 uncharacterized protein YqhQ [Keratinibaculum paraultunense]
MKIKDIKRVPKHITTIGGQALIEGILMRGPEDVAIAVRQENGEIVLKKEKLNTLGMRYKFFRLPFIRGIVSLIESLIFGIEALMYSAEFFDESFEEEEKKKDAEIVFTLLIALILTIVLFVLLPSLITNIFSKTVKSSFAMNLLEGLVRIGIFLIYVISVSKMEDVGRVFEYHGAEHKTIHCYENGEELTVENVKKYPTLHPRCGTSFLFMVMIVSIFVFSFFGWPNPLKRILIRILMLPVVAGISYEINRLIGKSNSKLAYYISYPGLILQKIATTKEPDEVQIEVAIEALKAVLTENKEDDLWT